MKVILDEKDIENIIKSAYNGVNEISFGADEFNVELDVDSDKFSQSVEPVRKTSKPSPKKSSDDNDDDEGGHDPTIEEKNQKARKKGLMATGQHSKRNLQMIG